ncbi:L,D-transpeptidase family protein [Microbacterium sp.]|uniref:L,D-transpeptidase family protein n=1 Tax=Microbacterium sp. TaxID=51671 RepID=UPI0009267531|nr:L,D-transpeptidase family protein [Microbacterium sp.]MBN9186207.1 L,D-transpeptidase/peptidoglycan binding protein [Microbacterium sp.]MBN9192949.1 L,D-transpeptidase/peptidoglycan binding protein [Microbacterium sp.]OJU63778.1 MAG: hypothetical protein BGO04_04040 [Microbacterium sp. 70-38]
MTDSGTTPGAQDAPTSAPEGPEVTYAWAPTAPAPRKRRLALWIGTPLAVAIVGVVAASLVLIAPGTAVAGVPVGGMTAGAAAEAIQSRLAHTTVELSAAGVDATLTGADLGASVDARSLAEAAYADHPMWKVGGWFSESRPASITLNPETANAALRKVLPDLYTDPTNARVTYQASSSTYVVTPAVEGKGVDLAALATAIETSFAKGESTVSLTPTTAPVQAATTTAYAQTTATSLNKLLGTVGFYVGSERTVPVAPAVAASWLTLSTHPDGAISIDADTAVIQKTVDTLAKAVNRAPVNGTVVTDTAGKVLSTETTALDGRTLGDTSGIASAFAAQLAKGNGVYALPVTIAKATTTKVSRNIVVDLSTQTATLFQDGKVFRTYLISSGLPGHDTITGNFKIFAKVYIQDMGCFPGAPYCTKNVPWVSYFNGDQALHGAYWHHNFGHRMSHGCVNMPLDVAKFVYYWAPIGTEVRVQY